MSDSANLIEAEQAISSLLEELKKLKTASSQIDVAREGVEVLRSTTEAVLQKTAHVVDEGAKAFDLIRDADLKSALQAILEMQKQHSARLERIEQQAKRVFFSVIAVLVFEAALFAAMLMHK